MGLLNHLQCDAEAQTLRTDLLQVWELVRLAVACLSYHHKWQWPCVVGVRAAEVIRCSDECLPSFAVTQEQLMDFEKVSCCVTKTAARALAALPRGSATRSSVGACVGLTANGKVVGILRDAVWRCEAEGINHEGDLFKLLFS